MAEPTRYIPGFNYSGWEADHPTEPKPGAELDNDFANIRHSIDETIRALKDVRRSDGQVRNGTVGFDALQSGVKAAIAGKEYDYDALAGLDDARTYRTAETVMQSNVPASAQTIRTNGYYTPGDGGGALYKRVETEPDHPGKIKDALGQWWELARLEYIDVAWFGAVGGEDCTQAFQNALDAAAALQVTKVRFRVPDDGSFYGITTIRIPPGVTLEGDAGNAGFQECQDVDWDNETGRFACLKALGPVNTPVIEMSRQSAVRNFRMVDLRQKRQVTVLDEPWNDTQYAIQLGHDGAWYDAALLGQTVENIVFVGFTKFVCQYYSGSGTPRGGRNLTFSRLYGIPFGVGVEILFTNDICWAKECQFITTSISSGFILGDNLLFNRNLARSVTGWKLGRADGFQLYGCQAMFVKYFLHSFRDAYETDQNVGGGFNAVNCPIDVCGVGYRLDRANNNAIGGSIVGGQIIPIVVQPGGEANSAIQLNTAGTPVIGFGFYLANVSIHDGGAGSSTPVNGTYTGPESVRTPQYVADFKNATLTRVSLVNCRTVAISNALVDRAKAYANGNGFTAIGCMSRDQKPITILESGGGGNATAIVASDGSTSAQLRAFLSDGEHVSTDSYSATLRILASVGVVEVRAGGLDSDYGAIRLSQVGNFHPATDGLQNCGIGPNRWGQVFAATGTINTSDAREKTPLRAPSEKEVAVAIRLSRLPGIYQWLSAIDRKGEEAARLHMGVLAQDVKSAFESEGLDGFRYGVLCWDEWGAEDAVLDEDGNEMMPARKAGDRYGIRYDELAQWQAVGWNARLEALEGIDD